MAYGNGQVDNWSGGNAAPPPRFQATYMSTDSNGIQSYQVLSSDNGYGPQELRILKPTNPAPGVAHNFLFVLPVEMGLGTTYRGRAANPARAQCAKPVQPDDNRAHIRD